MSTANVCLRLDPFLWQAAKSRAQAEESSGAAVVSAALRTYLGMTGAADDDRLSEFDRRIARLERMAGGQVSGQVRYEAGDWPEVG